MKEEAFFHVHADQLPVKVRTMVAIYFDFSLAIDKIKVK